LGIDEIAWTLKRITEIKAKRDGSRGENRRFYEIALRGWYRHLTYAREEAERHHKNEHNA
jgi:hypothetical protein